MSAKHAERTITYASPEDWDSWSNEFKKLAHAYDLWQYIDPTDRIRWPQRPELPEIRDYPRQADPDDPDSGTMTPGSDYVPPRRIGELTSEGRAEYEHDIRIYSLKETAYRETKKQEQKLVEFVLKTVSATYQKTSCVTGDRLDKWYQELRRSGVVYNERLRPEARDKYHKAVHTAPKINKLNEWVTEWETTMAEAISKKVPDALDAQCWAEDLNRAMYHVLPSWASTFRQHRRPQILNNSLNYREVAADIRYEAKMANASGRPSGIKRGAFTATYGAASRNDRPAITDRDNDTIEVQGDASDWATDETSYAHRDTRGQGRGRRARGGGRGVSTKRKRAETTVNPNPDGPTCRGCLGFHDWRGCCINLDASTQEEDEELSALPEGLAFEREAASYPHRGFERDPTITQGETGRTLVVGDRNREEPDGTDHPYTTARFTPYLTPETCPLRPAALLVATIREPPARKEGEKPPQLRAAKMVHVPPSAGTSPGRDGANGASRVISTPSSYWEAAFNAGRLASVKGTWNGKVQRTSVYGKPWEIY
ncbi:hypothetical protein FOFC_03612 [Fusarium oxysporum]|nr:hypothetical protein FOFC_17515 [Fusarium oxysporum]KAI8411460.1 hypothetical protein FOFC_08054 [Fusarium oxysporum]KAI8417299.1 hypothetical protein FOFC_03612 [Fusarium oxysporum]